MILEWLLAPIDASRSHHIDLTIAWHARIMVIGWGVLIPTGIVIARYFKVTPGQDWPRALDNPFWWHSHLGLQQLGVALSIAGIALAVWASVPAHALHKVLGWAVFAGGLLQVLSGWLRGTKGGPTAPAPDGSMRGDHYDMTIRRVIFEAVHKTLGYVLLVTAAVTILLGLWSVNAPVWMWLAITGYWVGLAGVAILAERRGMAIGSYQAIWGPDPKHPGNRQ
ncbi:MAG: cytochrome b561 domain-containing protein [Pseudomonadota bacterium]